MGKLVKRPQSPPEFGPLLEQVTSGDPQLFARIFLSSRPVDEKGRYVHWDKLRYLTPPEGLTHEQWWLGVSMSRHTISRPLPPVDNHGNAFRFSNVDRIQQMVHRIDQHASGQILTDERIADPRSSDRYLMSSLVEEAITSSQLEGASTTRRVAKELLRSGRRPRDRSERMIFNNFTAMQNATRMARGSEPLTPDDVLRLHRIVTDGTLDDPADAGRLQTPDEERITVGSPQDDTILHWPPPAGELPERLERMCEFANGKSGDGFIHPVVRAIVLHFWLAYDHPFVDGNGRTARALFYWSMLRSGYWLAQYISISSILRKAPVQYARSYLHTETDANDMTYFIIYQLRVIERAIESLRRYLAAKVKEIKELESLLRDCSWLNHRQLALLSSAVRDPAQRFTIKAQQRIHQVAYQSARTDLLGLEESGLLTRAKFGREFVFTPANDLSDRLESLAQW